MDAILQLAPKDALTSFMALVVPLFAAGLGLTLVFWFVGGVWAVIVSIFDV